MSNVEASSSRGWRMTTDEYLYDTEESNRKCELAYGVVREPPSPFFSHQELVLRIAMLLRTHVEPRDLGKVAIAPLDVVLDRDRALILQPDVLFVACDRLSIIRNQVWGPPDLVVEVLSLSTERRDRTGKMQLYRQYGVREAWLVDLIEEQVVVHDFTGALPLQRAARGVDSVRSAVLPELETSAFGIFA
jgi:Uma2 family endonuclease